MQAHGEYSHYPQPHPYASPPLSPWSDSDSPFAPLPADASPVASPAPAQEHRAAPSYGYPDTAYPSYGKGKPAGDPSRRIKSEEAVQPDQDAHRYPPSESKLHQFIAAYKSRNQLVFLSLIAVQAVTVLVMIALVYGVVRANTGDLSTSDLLGSDPQLESVATYLGLFILAVCFEIGITLDAMQKKNIMTLAVLCAFQIAMLVYSSVLPHQLENAISGSNADTPHVQHLTRIFATVIPGVVALCSFCMICLLWPLYHEFGWNVFKRIGADIAIRRMYLQYQVFVCVLKFAAFFLIGFSLQFLILVTGTPTVEFVLTIVALPVTLIALVFFAVTVRSESRPGVYISFVIQAAGMAYYSYKLARIYNTSSSDRYHYARATLTIFSVLSIVMLLATFVLMGLCMLNFGKGLKDRIPGYAFTRSSLFPSSRRRRSPAQTHAHDSSFDASTASHAPLAYGHSPAASPHLGAGDGVGGGGYGLGMGERSKTRMSMD